MVVGVRAVASVEALEKVVNAVVVVVKVVEIVDAVVVVVARTGFLEEGGIRWNGGFKDRKIDDDSRRNAGIRPHHAGERLVSWVKPGVMNAVPVALPALIGGLNGRHAQAAALDKLGLLGGFRTVMNGLNKREKTAGQHQKDDGDGHGESLSLLNVLCVLF